VRSAMVRTRVVLHPWERLQRRCRRAQRPGMRPRLDVHCLVPAPHAPSRRQACSSSRPLIRDSAASTSQRSTCFAASRTALHTHRRWPSRGRFAQRRALITLTPWSPSQRMSTWR